MGGIAKDAVQFCGGLVVGLAGLLLAGGVAIAAIHLGASGASGPIFVRGAEVSRAGGYAFVAESAGARVTQRCNGVCDDLGPLEPVKSVKVLDGRGHCLACGRLEAQASTVRRAFVGQATTPGAPLEGVAR